MASSLFLTSTNLKIKTLIRKSGLLSSWVAIETNQMRQKTILTAPTSLETSLGIILHLNPWMNRLTQARMRIPRRNRTKQQLHLRPQASLKLLPLPSLPLSLPSSLLGLKHLLPSLLNDRQGMVELSF
jgi:hypothetical protein